MFVLDTLSLLQSVNCWKIKKKNLLMRNTIISFNFFFLTRILFMTLYSFNLPQFLAILFFIIFIFSDAFYSLFVPIYV